MEPEKFEKSIKEQLQRREIKPSAGSWEKLEGRLEQKEERSKRPFLWLGLAAAFAAIFVLMGTFFSNPFTQNEPAVVEETSEMPVKLQQESPEFKPDPTKEVMIASEETETPEILQPEESARVLNEKNKALAVVTEPGMETKPASEEIQKPDLASVKKKLSEEHPEMLAKISDSEIEALLLLAEADMDEASAGYATKTVSPDDLLNEVEYELEQSFRDKIFQTITEGFSKAKTAVANRNF